MDVAILSRLQLSTATMFHFLIFPLTLGLSVLVAYMETRYVRTGDETTLRMTKFWGKLFLINFVLGVVTGISLEFQFGTKLHEIVHAIPSAFILAAFFMMGISAWHLLKKQEVEFFTKLFNIGLVVGLVSSLIVAFTGDLHAVHVAEAQPSKLAAMESHRGTQSQAPLPNLFPSSIDPAYSLSAFNASSSPLTLKIMLIVVLLFVPVVLVHQARAYKLFDGKLTDDDLAHYEGY